MGNDTDRKDRPRDVSWAGYQVVITKNTEYHLKHGWCIAVVSRRSRQVRANHPMVGQKLRGCVISSDAWQLVDEPVIGGALWFVEGTRDFLSSTIEAIQVPSGDDAPFAMSPDQWVQREVSTPDQQALDSETTIPPLPRRAGKDDAEK